MISISDNLTYNCLDHLDFRYIKQIKIDVSVLSLKLNIAVLTSFE